MSNNPPLPPPDMDDFEATMIREQNSDWLQRAEEAAELSSNAPFEQAPPIKKRAQPRRREKLLDRNDWKTIAVTAGFCGLTSFACGLLGIVFGLWVT